jgi:hypothetical protein
MPRSAAAAVKRARGCARGSRRIRHCAIVRMEAIFFTVETLSTMTLRATAEGGAPKARH